MAGKESDIKSLRDCCLFYFTPLLEFCSSSKGSKFVGDSIEF